MANALRPRMKTLAPPLLLAATISLAASAAFAGASNGPSALALSTLVAEQSPLVPVQDKRLLTAYLEGRADAAHVKGKVVAVKAEAIECRAGNVDVTDHVCELDFGGKKTTLKGRRAHELYATLAENGVKPDGAAGATLESVTALECLVDADEVREKAGGGARCAFAP